METNFGNKRKDGIKMEFEWKSNDIDHVDNTDCGNVSSLLNESNLYLNMTFQED